MTLKRTTQFEDIRSRDIVNISVEEYGEYELEIDRVYGNTVFGKTCLVVDDGIEGTKTYIMEDGNIRFNGKKTNYSIN